MEATETRSIDGSNDGPNQDDLNTFFQRITFAKQGHVGPGMPDIEAPRRLAIHFNRGSMDAFDSVGYFVYQGVRVYEVGKKEDAKRRENIPMEELLHSRRAQPQP